MGKITLFDNLIITVDPMNYTLQKTGVSKNGNEYSNIIGHYGSLESALIAAKKECVRKEICSQESLTLEDAISVIVRSNNRFESYLKQCFEEITT